MKITIQKKNPAGEVTYEYKGVLLNRDENSITLEAFFDRDDMPFQDVIFKKGDRFLEYYYYDRWYNVFEIIDRDDGNIKGWYCNVGMPVVMEGATVSYIDLALDLWVSINGDQVVLDEDEFEKLEMSDEMRIGALNGLKELKLLFATKKSPQ